MRPGPADAAGVAPGAELVLTTTSPANGGSCIARHDGRVVFVRYALPGERVRVRITRARGAYLHGECVEVLDASADRVSPLCPISGVDGAGCCDLSFARPEAARDIKAEVVANQLERLGGHRWRGPAEPMAGPAGAAVTGWRTRVRLAVGDDGLVGFHRHRSDRLVTDLRCGQLPPGMLDGLAARRWTPDARVHVVLDDEDTRHVVEAGTGRRRVVEGARVAVRSAGDRRWLVPITSFWQAHRGAAQTYSALVAQWCGAEASDRAWDLYGGAGLFAAPLAAAVGGSGAVLSVDTAPAASRAARSALADLPQVRVVTASVRRALARERDAADVAVLDPPRTGAGRGVIELLSAAEVPRVVHIGCEAASFARDIGLYRRAGYRVERLRVFDAFPLTHHVECVALLTR